jgi:hypothetical protein
VSTKILGNDGTLRVKLDIKAGEDSPQSGAGFTEEITIRITLIDVTVYKGAKVLAHMRIDQDQSVFLDMVLKSITTLEAQAAAFIATEDEKLKAMGAIGNRAARLARDQFNRETHAIERRVSDIIGHPDDNLDDPHS